MTPVANAPVLYSAIIKPHRSAGVAGTRTLVLLVAAAWAVVGTVFVIAGAWPVVPFLGLEIALLAGAFALNNRAARAEESINLTAVALTVRRVDHWGKQTVFSFPPQWLQVNTDVAGPKGPRLELRSHGRSLFIGSSLLPEERLALARTLRRELARLTQAAMAELDPAATPAAP
jgi:uncharacterized membrane protein